MKVVRAKVDSVEEARKLVKEAQLYAYTFDEEVVIVWDLSFKLKFLAEVRYWKTKLLTLLKKLLRRH